MRVVECDLCRRQNDVGEGEWHTLGIKWGSCDDDIDLCGDCARALRVYMPDAPFACGQRVFHNLIISLLRERASARKREGKHR